MSRDPFTPLIKAAHALCDLEHYDLSFRTAGLARDAIGDEKSVESLRQKRQLISLHERIWLARNASMVTAMRSDQASLR